MNNAVLFEGPGSKAECRPSAVDCQCQSSSAKLSTLNSQLSTADRPVGFFDSGRGGLCILEAFKKLCPNESTVYIADSANCPYGNKPSDEIIALADAHTQTLLNDYGCKMIVVACNTATAAAIDYLREKYKGTPFIGIEPAVKTAAMESKSLVVGVLATAGTFSGRLYNETKAKFASDVTIIATVADEFVELVEDGRTDGDVVEKIVRRRLEPLLAAGADQIVLGCTHFPHLKPVMERVCGGRASIIDPSFAVARQAKRILESNGIAAPLDAVPTSKIISTEKPPRRSVVVTGGTKRLGKAIADRLAESGWRVLRTSHRAESGADIIADLATSDGADRLFAEAVKILGGAPDAIVNNAAVYLSDEATTRQVNFASPIRLMQLLAESSECGAVVNIIDAAILNGREETRREFRAYADTKRQLLDATLKNTLRVRANAVAPGSVLPPDGIHEKAMPSPSGRRPTPDDVAAAVENLLSSQSTGQLIAVT